MGSLKDEMKGLVEDHQYHEAADNGDGVVAPEGRQINMSTESTTPQREVRVDPSSTEEGDEDPVSKNHALSEEDGDRADSEVTQTVTTHLPESLHKGAGDPEAQTAMPVGDILGQDRDKEAEHGSALVPVASTPDTSNPRSPDPHSPAPFGQQHMRTQVSLEVVQCCSAATSPMTPPEGGHSFFFPSSFAGSATKDGELKVGQQVEFCSIATSPMTPKTPFSTAFPELAGKEMVKKEGQVKEEQKEYSNQPGKQQRMGSMDQDITILVTHHGNNEEGDEEEIKLTCHAEPKTLEEAEENGSDEKDSKCPQIKPTSATVPAKGQSDSSEVSDDRAACEGSISVPVTKPSVPESPAPFGCHNMRTQVSLEVVQCQSAATSPMTPPEGDHAFHFPSFFGKCDATGAETKDVKVEFRSVATAPMTPRTPTASIFPEIRKEASKEEKIVEERVESKQAEEDNEEAPEEEEEEEEEGKGDKTEAINCKVKGEEKSEEPVQEVNWDEKGMTWEVYGAVVEVSVLGSAIQKHLEKQVKKQKLQPAMPPPPPLDPSAAPVESEPSEPSEPSDPAQPDQPAQPTQGCSGSGKCRAGGRGERDGKVGRRRRNPFRQLMENMQQPHCCTRAHTTE